MNSYRYRITVQALTDAKGQPVEGRSLQFEAANHDDLLGVVERVRTKRLVADEDAAAALAIGLKLFAEVALAKREEPMFAEVYAALSTFIRSVKARPAA